MLDQMYFKEGRMSEQSFMNEGNVQVTRSRVVIGSNTYPVNGITNINTRVVPPSRSGSIALGIIGLLALLVGGGNGMALLIGVACIGLAIFLWVKAKPTYILLLGTAGADKQALTSYDANFVGRVSHAISDALIARG